MKAKTAKRRELKSIGYELFIGALSILSIANLVLMYVFAKDQNLQYVLAIMNTIMTPIFLGDFIYRITTSEARATYFFRGFGWADLLSSLPFPQLKILRLFRLWRVIRLFMEFGVGNLIHEFITHRAQNALLTVVFLVLCVLEFGSLAMITAERSSPNANITNAGDAIWWAYVTITTVGYGDFYPVSASGRIVGAFVMTAGVGLFGTLSGFLANTLLSPAKPKEVQGGNDREALVNDPKARLAMLVQKVEAQEKIMAELKAELTKIDALL